MFRIFRKQPKYLEGVFASFEIRLKTGQCYNLDFHEFWNIEDKWSKYTAYDQVKDRCVQIAKTRGFWRIQTFHPPHSIESVTFEIQESLVKEIQ